MAELNTQNQTAATDTPPAATPAGKDNRSPVTQPGKDAVTPLTELDLDSMLSAELDADLPRPKSKKDEKADPKKEEEEPEGDDPDPEVDPDPEPEGDDPDNADPEPGEDDDEPAEIGDDEEVDPEKPPKGFEKVPKGIWKRQNKLLQKQRELKAQIAQGPVQITPTPASPLADVETVEALDQRLASAKAVRDWCRENPDGGTVKGAGGREIELTPEEVRSRMAFAESVIEAAPDVKVTLTQRANEKPWEMAESIAPGLFEKTTEEYRFMTDLLKTVPELKRHPAWEVFVAVAAKGMRQTVEERTKKAKYVRYELDKDGKMIPPKSGLGAGKKDKANPDIKPKPKSPTSPGNTRPNITAKPTKPTPMVRPDQGSGDSNLAAMLDAELGSF